MFHRPMNAPALMEGVTHFAQSHAALTIGIVAVVGVLTYLKPKEMFKLLLAALVLGAIVYVVMLLIDLTSTGIEESTKFLGKPKVK